MNSRELLADGVIAVVVAAVVLIVAPGLAVVAIVAIVVLVAMGIDLLIRRRRGRSARYRRSPPRRPPAARP